MKKLIEAVRTIVPALPPLVEERFVFAAESIEQRERVLIGWLLDDAQRDDVDILRTQAAAARLVYRKFTEHGFISEFAIPSNVHRTREDQFELADHTLQLEGLQFGAGIVLFIRDGRMHSIAGRCWGPEQWPTTEIRRRTVSG